MAITVYCMLSLIMLLLINKFIKSWLLDVCVVCCLSFACYFQSGSYYISHLPQGRKDGELAVPALLARLLPIMHLAAMCSPM